MVNVLCGKVIDSYVKLSTVFMKCYFLHVNVDTFKFAHHMHGEWIYITLYNILKNLHGLQILSDWA